MTSSVKITVFFVLAMTISCYGQSTTSSTTTASDLDACANLTTCAECTGLVDCVFKLKNCSAILTIATDADYECVHKTHPNVTAVEEFPNCTIKAADDCKTGNGSEAAPATNATTLTPAEGTTSEPSTTMEPTSGSPTEVATTKAASEVTTPSTPAEELTTPISSVTTTSTNSSGSTTPEEPEHTSTDGHPSTSDHTSPPAKTSRHFDAPSFIGGIILSVGLLAIAFVGYKFYRARTEHNYHTL